MCQQKQKFYRSNSIHGNSQREKNPSTTNTWQQYCTNEYVSLKYFQFLEYDVKKETFFIIIRILADKIGSSK